MVSVYPWPIIREAGTRRVAGGHTFSHLETYVSELTFSRLGSYCNSRDQDTWGITADDQVNSWIGVKADNATFGIDGGRPPLVSGEICPFPPREDPQCIEPELNCVYTVVAVIDPCPIGCLPGAILCTSSCPPTVNGVCLPTISVTPSNGCVVIGVGAPPVCFPCADAGCKFLILAPNWLSGGLTARTAPAALPRRTPAARCSRPSSGPSR